MMLTFTINSIAELKNFSEYLLSNFLNQYKKVFFYGEVGAGKTTLIKLLCKGLGVEENTSSPTFSIVNQYMTKDSHMINHVDLYRLRDVNEAYDAGIFELLADKDYLFLEWPEIIEGFTEINFLKIELEIQEADSRAINVCPQ